MTADPCVIWLLMYKMSLSYIPCHFLIQEATQQCQVKICTMESHIALTLTLLPQCFNFVY